MIVLTILLKILQILGIILLAILALILFVFILVLFVPIRYKAKGSFHEKVPKVYAKVTYLLSIVHVSFELGREKPLLIRVFGIPINDKEKKSVKDNNTEQPDGIENSMEDAPKEEKPKEETSEIEAPKAETVDEEVPAEDKPKTEAPVINEVEETVGEPEEKEGKSEDSSTKKTGFYDKLKKYLELIQSDCFKKSFSLCKKTLGKIFKHILPRKWEINGSISLEDPATTAKIFEITSILYPWTYKHIHVSTDFNGEHIDVDGYVKGHITLIKLVWLAFCVYFNKNIKKLIKLIKEV